MVLFRVSSSDVSEWPRQISKHWRLSGTIPIYLNIGSTACSRRASRANSCTAYEQRGSRKPGKPNSMDFKRGAFERSSALRRLIGVGFPMPACSQSWTFIPCAFNYWSSNSLSSGRFIGDQTQTSHENSFSIHPPIYYALVLLPEGVASRA